MSTIFGAHTFAIQALVGRFDWGSHLYIRHLERVAMLLASPQVSSVSEGIEAH